VIIRRAEKTSLPRNRLQSDPGAHEDAASDESFVSRSGCLHERPAYDNNSADHDWDSTAVAARKLQLTYRSVALLTDRIGMERADMPPGFPDTAMSRQDQFNLGSADQQWPASPGNLEVRIDHQ
jgi:hypothetical protein